MANESSCKTKQDFGLNASRPVNYHSLMWLPLVPSQLGNRGGKSLIPTPPDDVVSFFLEEISTSSSKTRENKKQKYSEVSVHLQNRAQKQPLVTCLSLHHDAGTSGDMENGEIYRVTSKVLSRRVDTNSAAPEARTTTSVSQRLSNRHRQTHSVTMRPSTLESKTEKDQRKKGGGSLILSCAVSGQEISCAYVRPSYSGA